MNTWSFANNTFLVITKGSFKLMNILITDHAARIAQAVMATTPPDSDFTTIQGRTTPVKTAWDTAYNAWIAARGIYKGKTQALQTRLGNFSAGNPSLVTLATTVGTFHGEIKGLHDAQQGQEGAVESASTAVEGQRIASGNLMFQNLGRLMEKFFALPVKIEDFYDMSYIRDGITPPPEEPPAPPAPPVP